MTSDTRSTPSSPLSAPCPPPSDSQPQAVSGAETAAAPPQSFEEALQELQMIVQALEQGDLSLSDSLARYEQGVRCLKSCYQQLEQAERRVAVLRGLESNGEIITEPFDDDAEMTLEAKAASRGARRSRANRPAQE
jgi:exodeoxyribonuclease VII small subunit